MTEPLRQPVQAEQPPLPRWRGSAPRFSEVALFCVALFMSMPGLARADCECGYAATVGNNGSQRVFTDLIETDFEHIADMSTNTDWARQAFNLTSQRARGQFGEMFSLGNARPNPSRDHNTRVGPGTNGRAAGLELVVGGNLVDGMVPVAEVASSRLDILWGSFRIGMKLTDTPGTCAAFFWYFNDTQEIDMEFLSRDYNASNSTWPVNLVLQSRAAVEKGFDAQAAGDFKKVNLPFDPSLDFHEYRMDFLPGRVLFYADGQILTEMAGAAVPQHAGHLILQHWSNGNPKWSGGPPTQDAIMTVSYVKAYFNSSTQARQNDWAGRCKDSGAANAICAILGNGDVRSPSFFSSMPNMTNNQSISGSSDQSKPTGRAGQSHARQSLPWVVLPLLVGGWASGVWRTEGA